MCIPQTHTHTHATQQSLSLLSNVVVATEKQTYLHTTHNAISTTFYKTSKRPTVEQLVRPIYRYVCKYVRSFYFVHFMFVCPSIHPFVRLSIRRIPLEICKCSSCLVYRQRERERSYIHNNCGFIFNFVFLLYIFSRWSFRMNVGICVLISKSGTVIVRSFRSFNATLSKIKFNISYSKHGKI